MTELMLRLIKDGKIVGYERKIQEDSIARQIKTQLDEVHHLHRVSTIYDKEATND